MNTPPMRTIKIKRCSEIKNNETTLKETSNGKTTRIVGNF